MTGCFPGLIPANTLGPQDSLDCQQQTLAITVYGELGLSVVRYAFLSPFKNEKLNCLTASKFHHSHSADNKEEAVNG